MKKPIVFAGEAYADSTGAAAVTITLDVEGAEYVASMLAELALKALLHGDWLMGLCRQIDTAVAQLEGRS